MNARVLSLDAFRGFTIAAMLLVNNPGSWSHMYGPLAHAPWHGWTFTDWIFPFFVFISGMAMPISLGRRAAMGDDKLRLLAQTARRAATIIAIGLLLNWIPAFDLAELRIPGVLQRLGLCTLLAAPIVLWWGWRGQLVWALGLLAAYAAAMLLIPVPGADGIVRTGALLPGQDLGAFIDRALLGEAHLWKQAKTWDPEGLLSTVPAVATQLFGVLAGQWLLSRREPGEKAMWFMVSGLACLWIGQLLDAWLMPINKNLWTPSYVFAMAGWAQLVFACCYWLLDAMPLPLARARMAQLAKPLLVFGMNALFIFALSGLVAKLLGSVKPDGQHSLKALLYAPIQQLGLAPVNASLLYALGFLSAMYVVAWVMWKKQWFIKV
ncbi:acyltransferase family protein [Roseateles sp.]|jgi:predicted acyltransferase|uniref:acyltransferase family protein n=1 Tax=Roseateles sp. TaxID=1971397 RepID=UPI0037C79968